MLSCTACIRRCLRVIVGDVIGLKTVQRSYRGLVATDVPSRSTQWHHKSYATAAAAYPEKTDHDRHGEDAAIPSNRHNGRPGWPQDQAQLAPRKQMGVLPAVDKETSPGRSVVPYLDPTALEKELRYLQDPMKLADNTISLLKKNDFEKALALVKMSSRPMACTVSWNHLMDYEMFKGRVSNAMKTYNDMKKRAQHPDAHTFTILLRGLASHTNYPTALQRALSLYHSMYAENSPVRPTIIHTNAVLKVCARAKDLDSLWGVAARLPKTGRNAPDTATFTTILNAVYRIARETARENDQGGTVPVPEDKAERLQQAVMQGRRIWAEIVERWRNGDIRVDEDLVCSMGRLLILSEAPKDLDDVLSLVEQTMGIQRQVTRLAPGAALENPADRYLSTSTPQESQPSPLERPEDKRTDFVPASHEPDRPSASAEDEFIPGQEFDTIAPNTSEITGYVVPGRNTLSLIVDACTRLHRIRAAQDYWGLLTSPPYNIAPDTDNYHTYLRLLRVQRASRLCVELVQEMRDGLGVGPPVAHSERRSVKGEEGGVQAKTFRIAMSTCLRDMNNPNVLQHAGKLCRMMIDCLPKPDMRAFSMYLDVGLKTAAAREDWRLLSSVLRGTEIGVRALRNHLNWEDWTKDRKTYEYREILQGDLRVFLRKLIGAYDFLINGSGHEMVHDELRKCKEQKNIIAGWETRLARVEGNVRGRKPAWAGGKDKIGDEAKFSSDHQPPRQLTSNGSHHISDGGEPAHYPDGNPRSTDNELGAHSSRAGKRRDESTRGGARQWARGSIPTFRKSSWGDFTTPDDPPRGGSRWGRMGRGKEMETSA